MKLKHYLILAISLLLTIAISIGGTVAYLTVKDEPKLNVFTIGNIDIEVEESASVNGDTDRVFPNEDGGYDYGAVIPGDVLEKVVTVTNTGDSAAYVRVSVTLNNALAINQALDEVYEAPDELGKNTPAMQAMYDTVFTGWGINYMPRVVAGYPYDDARGIIDTYPVATGDGKVLQVDFTKTTEDGSWLFGAKNWFKGEGEMTDGNYTGSTWSDGEALGYYAGEMYKTGLDDHIRYTYYIYLPEGESVKLFDGLKVPEDFNREQLAMFDDLDIKIEAAAIQAANMGTPYEAFAALKDAIPTIDATFVKTPDELREALAEGGLIYLTKDVTFTADDLTHLSGYSEGIAVVDGQEVVLDLNGHDLVFEDTADGGVAAAFYVRDGKLTVQGKGSVTQTAPDDYLFWATGTGEINIMSGNYAVVGTGCLVYASGASKESHGTVNIYGGTFENETVNGQSYFNILNHGLGSINAYGGSYVNWNPATDVSYDDRNYAKVADGCSVVATQQTDGSVIYTVY